MADDLKACTALNCNRPAKTKGFCKKHYESLRKYGRLEPIRAKNKGAKCAAGPCDRPAAKRGWCIEHYGRWQRHGNPDAGRVSPDTLRAWIVGRVSTTSDECLKWPFGTAGLGRGVLTAEGEREYAHRLMCTLAHGPAPTPEHEAAHSCGKGHEGCVNPRHLRWATAKENHADMVVHGTVPRGRNNAQAKLGEADVQDIRSRLGIEPYSAISQRFGVSKSLIYQIKAGRVWGWLR